MLKLANSRQAALAIVQPPSGGCVLKQFNLSGIGEAFCQPPSGGCVLKRHGAGLSDAVVLPAAFGRLCVETLPRHDLAGINFQPPSGGCVLKLSFNAIADLVAAQPPSGGCVLKRR